jgi:elongation of very long chain fatty acids protein 6
VFRIENETFINPKYRANVMNWMTENWTLSFLISFIYILTIYGLGLFMVNRQEFKLRIILILWNAALAIFSILGAYRTLPEFSYILATKGFKYSVCVETYSHGVTGFWSWMFTLSKPLELIDTIFLLLRKREVIFLHWYHHSTVLLFAWYSMSDYPATGRWFATINYSIHAIMYTYYTIMALKIVRMPKWISIMITGSQIVQMIIGVYVNHKAYQYKQSGESCSVTYFNIYTAQLMYASYFYLFFRFFLDKYINSKQKIENGKLKQS